MHEQQHNLEDKMEERMNKLTTDMHRKLEEIEHSMSNKIEEKVSKIVESVENHRMDKDEIKECVQGLREWVRYRNSWMNKERRRCR